MKIRNLEWDRIPKLNLFIEKGISDCNFWNVYPMKIWVLLLFLIATWLNSLELYMKISLRLEFGKVSLNKETGIYK